MKYLILVAALTGCHNGGGDTDGNTNLNDTSITGDDSGEKIGEATVSYTVSVLGNQEPCQINLVCDGNATYTNSLEEIVEVEAGTAFSVPTGTVVEVEAPAACEATAGLTEYTSTFGFPVHLGTDGEYWASAPLEQPLEPDDEISVDFSTFNLFEPGDYVCWYDKYELDEGASDLKGEQWMEHEEVDKQHVAVLQDGTVEVEDDQNMDIIGRDEDHMQVVGDELVLIVEAGGNPYYIADSDIGVNYFNLTVVNTEAGYVGDVWCELDE